MELLIPYLVIMNAAGLLLMLMDKRRAKRKLWRISEATLMTVAALGGSIGTLIGMNAFHHKTKKPLFAIGVPLLMAAHLWVVLWLCKII